MLGCVAHAPHYGFATGFDAHRQNRRGEILILPGARLAADREDGLI
jgi:hypothetical protein